VTERVAESSGRHSGESAGVMTEGLRLHQFLPLSRANGPGARAVVWVQGCPLRCVGCFNPTTRPKYGGRLVSVDELVSRLVALDGEVEGLTVSGGEPFAQRPALLELLRRVRAETALSVTLFTGYTWEEAQRFPRVEELLGCIDVLIAGRYDRRQRIAHDLRGSANKTLHFLTDRYGPADLRAVPPAEIVITPEGDIVLSGIDPLSLSSHR
jgi:anaerobic ribonucleoside-triphosphate reductase activating protein